MNTLPDEFLVNIILRGGPAVRQVGWLGGKSGGRRPIATPGGAVADGAVPEVESLARFDVASVGGCRGEPGSEREHDPDETARRGQRDGEPEQDATPPHVTP